MLFSLLLVGSASAQVMDDTPTSTTLALIVVLAIIFLNVILMAFHAALMRFVFGVVSLAICGIALTYSFPFSPYLQLIGLLVSVLAMLAASRVRGD